MPGTVGSGVAFVVSLIVPPNWPMILTVILLGTWAADRYARQRGDRDPSEVVIDEVAGMWIAQYGLGASLGLGAFFIFRVLDVLKPFPIRQAEALPGGVGIMADDLLAGLATNIVLRCLVAVFLPGGAGV